MEIKPKSKPMLGSILEFDWNTGYGIVLSEGNEIKFHSTLFQSNPVRFPRAYDLVILTYDDGKLISIREWKESEHRAT